MWISGMECFEKECMCEVSSRVTPDGQICLRRWQKLLGDLCEPDFDACYHKSGTLIHLTKKNFFSKFSNDVMLDLANCILERLDDVLRLNCQLSTRL